MFTSDHGEAFGEHDVIFHGNGVWDANVRVPLVIRGPGLGPDPRRPHRGHGAERELDRAL